MSWQSDPVSLRDDFNQNGYVMLKQFVSLDHVAELNNNIARFKKDVIPTMPDAHVFYEDKNDPSSLKQLQQIWQHDDYFNKWMTNSDFTKVAQAVLNEPVVPKNMQYFNKPPNIGQPTPPHQDGYYFMLNPCQAVTMWFALEPVDEDNGCVRYIPGSHQKEMRPHSRTQTLGFSQGISDYTDADYAAELPMPAQPGDLLIHHAMTIHRAEGNHSQTRSRQALGFIYYGTSAKEDTQAHKAYQTKLAEEMKQHGKI